MQKTNQGFIQELNSAVKLDISFACLVTTLFVEFASGRVVSAINKIRGSN